MAVRSTSKETVVSPWAQPPGVRQRSTAVSKGWIEISCLFFEPSFSQNSPRFLKNWSFFQYALLVCFSHSPCRERNSSFPPFPTGDAYRALSCRSFPGRFALSINTVVSFLLSMVCIIDHLTMFVNENSDNKKSICL